MHISETSAGAQPGGVPQGATLFSGWGLHTIYSASESVTLCREVQVCFYWGHPVEQTRSQAGLRKDNVFRHYSGSCGLTFAIIGMEMQLKQGQRMPCSLRTFSRPAFKGKAAVHVPGQGGVSRLEAGAAIDQKQAIHSSLPVLADCPSTDTSSASHGARDIRRITVPTMRKS